MKQDALWYLFSTGDFSAKDARTNSEGLPGVKVVADDFVVVGRGDKIEDASRDHDKNLMALLLRCAERVQMMMFDGSSQHPVP